MPPFPSKPLKYRIIDWNNSVIDEHIDKLIERFEIVWVEIIQVSIRQILKCDAKPSRYRTITRAFNLSIGLEGHKKCNIKSFCLPVFCVLCNGFICPPEWQSPRGISNHKKRGAVGMNNVSALWRHAKQSVLQQRIFSSVFCCINAARLSM